VANTSVLLERGGKTEAGWKYYSAADSDSDGRVKRGIAIMDGREVKHEIRPYEPRYRKGTKAVFEDLGNASAADAERAQEERSADVGGGRSREGGRQVGPGGPRAETPLELTREVPERHG
jgi:hypothetical protein